MSKKPTYKEKFKSFYNSKAWKTLRAIKFADADGLCELCGKKVKGGDEVHHIKPIETHWDKRLDYDNLILLCRDCHNEQHDRVSQLQKFLKDWENLQKE